MLYAEAVNDIDCIYRAVSHMCVLLLHLLCILMASQPGLPASQGPDSYTIRYIVSVPLGPVFHVAFVFVCISI